MRRRAEPPFGTLHAVGHAPFEAPADVAHPGPPFGTRHASYEVDTVSLPRPVQLVWKRSPRGRSIRS